MSVLATLIHSVGNMRLVLRGILILVLFLHSADSRVIGHQKICVCTGDSDVNVVKQPDEDSFSIAALTSHTCYGLSTDHVRHERNGWLGINYGSETVYVREANINVQNCEKLADNTTRLQDSETSRSSTFNSTHGIFNRASSIGNLAACGHNLQLWAQQAPNRILAQRDKSCYGLQTGVKQTYQYAFTYCQSSVSYLVDIMDDQEQAFIELLVNRYFSGEKVWIGLHDIQNERFFDWTSGKPISYVNWFSVSQAYSSSNHDVQDCVTLVPFHGGKWEVESCYTGNPNTEPKHVFICEFEIKTPAQVVG